MLQDFYLDTSIWLDFYEKRGRNGELALKLILRIINEDLKIVYSDLHIKEFKNLSYTQNEINEILSIVKPNNIKRIHISKNQIEEAKKLAKQRNIPQKDALHAILARDNYLQLIATDPHFEQLKDVTSFKRPRDLI